jgi:hypothetical protein
MLCLVFASQPHKGELNKPVTVAATVFPHPQTTNLSIMGLTVVGVLSA